MNHRNKVSFDNKIKLVECMWNEMFKKTVLNIIPIAVFIRRLA